MIILVAGPSGVGKTTLAKKIAKEFQLPVIHKDDIKEIMFDALGWDDLDTSKKYGAASWDIFYHFAEEQVANGMDMILEANFKPEYAESKICYFQNKYDVKIIQIRCIADIDVTMQRFKARIKNGRHPGHNDHLFTDEDLRMGAKKESQVLNLDSTLIEVDMNDFSTIDYEEIFNEIGGLMNK